jgi:superfamily II DNA or RNA helicase
VNDESLDAPEVVRIPIEGTGFPGTLPAQWAIEGKIGSNQIIQLARPERRGTFFVSRRSVRGASQATLWNENEARVVVLPKGRKGSQYERVIDVPALQLRPDGFPYENPTFARWLRPASEKADAIEVADFERRQKAVLDSWQGCFHFKSQENGSQGLRSPQLGALFGILAHWAVHDDVATIVMPTGTGKTDTMLATFVQQRFQRLLVIVPSDALREQTARKFATLGWLKSAGVLDDGALYPIVGLVAKGFDDAQAAEDYLRSCNVVVTTMSLIANADANIAEVFARECSHLFVDEAHHTPAPTWNHVRGLFKGKRVVQFTATPFRNDGKHVDGQVVFRFPLGKAQEEGYFSPIRFRAIAEIIEDKADRSIASAAIGQLRADLDAGFDHLVMARTSTTERADALKKTYEEIGSNFGVVVLHSKIGPQQRVDARLALERRTARVVICVDMLGEGVDLPSLKVAAIHDTHRSLAVTLQFIGRFARTQANLGSATIVANVLDQTFEKSLRLLYSQDADWNRLLSTISDDETTRHAKRDAFARAFDEGVPSEIPMQNLSPKMSTVVYRTNATDWNPDKATEAFSASNIAAGPLINRSAHTIVIVTEYRSPVDWGDLRDVYNTIYDLHIAHWNPTLGLFFVNTTDKDDFHELLARTVLGGEPQLIRGESVFRVVHGINRLQLINLGTRHTINRRIQFSMLMGRDIIAALTDAEQQNRIKSNLFGYGFENGERTSIGCSGKGRVWAYRRAEGVPEWLDWASRVGKKLLDETITTDLLLRHVIFPEKATARPPVVPIAVEWDVEFIGHGEDKLFVQLDGDDVPFFEVGLDVSTFAADGPLRFKVSTSTIHVEYEVRFGADGAEYLPVDRDLTVRSGSKTLTLAEWFKKNPPVIRFSDGSFLMGADLCVSRNAPRESYDRNRILAWSWDGVDPAKESQRQERRQDSIQWKVIQMLRDAHLGTTYDMIFDDDSSGEAADVVAIRISERSAQIDLSHCKYAHAGISAVRIDDLYEVCGQAQKSVGWCHSPQKLFAHLRRRAAKVVARDGTRFELGDLGTLSKFIAAAPQLDASYRVHIVQPGLSKANASVEQLALLGSTATYLQETYGVDLIVIGAP